MQTLDITTLLVVLCLACLGYLILQKIKDYRYLQRRKWQFNIASAGQTEIIVQVSVRLFDSIKPSEGAVAKYPAWSTKRRK